jgi:hypothetical protein
VPLQKAVFARSSFRSLFLLYNDELTALHCGRLTQR